MQTLPCDELVAAVYRNGAWECADGSAAATPQGGLWLALQELVTSLQAGSGELTWLQRGPKLLSAPHGLGQPTRTASATRSLQGSHPRNPLQE